MTTTQLFKTLYTTTNLDVWTETRNSLRAKAATHLECLGKTVAQVVDLYKSELEYLPCQVSNAIKDNRLAYNMLKLHGWKTSEIISVKYD